MGRLCDLLYNSVQIVREQQPGSPLYESRIARWQMAADADAKALSFDPGRGVWLSRLIWVPSRCFYGNGTGDAVRDLPLDCSKSVKRSRKLPIVSNRGYC
jgi:hypothetical protein